MFRSMSINNCIFDKSRFWQGFPSENRLKSHRNPASAANASGSLQTTLSKLPDQHLQINAGGSFGAVPKGI